MTDQRLDAQPSEKDEAEPARSAATPHSMVVAGAILAVGAGLLVGAIDALDVAWAQIAACALIVIGSAAVFWAYRCQRAGRRTRISKATVGGVVLATVAIMIVGKQVGRSEDAAANDRPSGTPSGVSVTPSKSEPLSLGYQGGWGPERAVFSMKTPSPYVVFNSITDNPAHGDERNFVQVKAADQGNATYSDRIAVEIGKEYDVYILFDNDAAPNLGAAATARDARVRLVFGHQDRRAGVGAVVSALNAKDVWDGAVLLSDRSFSVRYVEGSARLTTKKLTDVPLPDAELRTKGALIGSGAIDGIVPSDFSSGYVVLRVAIDAS
ncbi:hypothetical protein AB0L64_39820 [Kribbella sp. NPDC051936]|jgi:hypothetical protein|uniref:hypothetical protein n=1 Tax=Kribbella sp. NPDC051936 TaxID=3154946 RepID=UPI003445E864